MSLSEQRRRFLKDHPDARHVGSFTSVILHAGILKQHYGLHNDEEFYWVRLPLGFARSDLPARALQYMQDHPWVFRLGAYKPGGEVFWSVPCPGNFDDREPVPVGLTDQEIRDSLWRDLVQGTGRTPDSGRTRAM